MLSVAPESGNTLTGNPVSVCVAMMRGVALFWTRLPSFIAATTMAPSAVSAGGGGFGGYFPAFFKNASAYCVPLNFAEAGFTKQS